jgi:C4-dicarboxylate-binding protein DctP
MKLIRVILTVTLFVLLLTHCNPAPSDLPNKAGSDKIVLRFGHDLSVQSPQHEAAVEFAKRVAQRSIGQIQIDVYPHQSLGSDRQMLAMAQKDELDIILPPTAKMSHIIPQLQIFDLPYLFSDSKSAQFNHCHEFS